MTTPKEEWIAQAISAYVLAGRDLARARTEAESDWDVLSEAGSNPTAPLAFTPGPTGAARPPVYTATEQMGVTCTAATAPSGEHILRLGGTFLPSLPNVYFGFRLTPETTLGQAEDLAAQITKHCPALFAHYIDQELDGLMLQPYNRLIGERPPNAASKDEWLARATAEYVREGDLAEHMDIDATEAWDMLSDHGRDPAAALAWEPEAAARKVIEHFRSGKGADDPIDRE